jgi:alpha-galactosidase
MGASMGSIFRLCLLVLLGAVAFAAPVLPATPQSGLEGSWTAAQSPNAGTARQATLTFVRAGQTLTGTMRDATGEMPLFDVRETGATVSFTLVIPGTPYISIPYNGTRDGDEIRLTGVDESHAVHSLTVRRVAAALASVQQAAPVLAPSPPQAAPPQVALRNVPPQPRASPRPVPQPPAPPASVANASGRLDGNWIATQTRAGSAEPVEANLVFTGNRGVMHAGAVDWPVFDVRETATDAAFTVVIPGTPYVTVRYAGSFADDMLELSGQDADQSVFHLTARRSPAAAVPQPMPAPTAQPSEPRVALLNPPPRPEAKPPQSLGPPPKLPLPALRDVPPNNLLKLPPMGWASRQKVGPDMEDDDIRQAAESLEETNLRTFGYAFIEIGDGWQGTRDTNGALHAGEKFPDMKGLGDYIHAKLLKFGLQVSAAPKSCAGFEGSYGHEAEDAKLFASWGVDYVVYDWCGAKSIYPSQAEQQAAYQKMGEALRASGRDIAFGISQEGVFDVARWGAKTGANLWRTGPDINDNWQSVTEAGFAANGKEANAGPGHWNDPGLIQTGNGGMTPDEYRTQLNLWAVLAAPIMLGNDVRIMTKETLATLSNGEMIAIDQDPLGRQGKRVAQNGQTEVWARPLADGGTAVAFFNRGDQSAPVGVSWQQLGIDGPRRVRDVWRHEDAGMANGRYVVFLTAHSSLLLRLSR